MTEIFKNPYTAPVHTSVTRERYHDGYRLTSLAFPLWGCIGLSGVLLGVLGGPLGMIVGGVLAFGSATVIVPVAIVALALTVGTRMTRVGLIAVGGSCGALSGITSTLVIFASANGGLVFAGIAAIMGGLGGMLPAMLTRRSSAAA